MILYRKYRDKIVFLSCLYKYQLKKCKYPKKLTLNGRYPAPQKSYLFLSSIARKGNRTLI